MYKLVAIDLDGTLLNSYGEVTTKTKEAIKKAVEKGVEVVNSSPTEKVAEPTKKEVAPKTTKSKK